MRIGLQLSTIFAIFGAPLFSAPPPYTITDLGGAVPYAINRLADVAGDSDFHAFLWSRGTMTIPPALSAGFSTARGLNDLRQVVGGHVNSSGSSVAFIFGDGVVTDLELPAGTTDTLAAAINDQGQILVNTLSGASAWVLSRDGPQEIPSLGGGYVSGNALNQRSEVVGDSIPAGANLTHAFLWSGSKLTDLGVLAGGEAGSYSSASAINDATQVAGQSSAAGQTQHAFVWAHGVMADLGTLPGDNQSYATAINNRGQIVGWSASATGGNGSTRSRLVLPARMSTLPLVQSDPVIVASTLRWDAGPGEQTAEAWPGSEPRLGLLTGTAPADSPVVPQRRAAGPWHAWNAR
jgi:probable HAF family extracellular repeat protein